jgi:hypothetical protein
MRSLGIAVLALGLTVIGSFEANYAVSDHPVSRGNPFYVGAWSLAAFGLGLLLCRVFRGGNEGGGGWRGGGGPRKQRVRSGDLSHSQIIGGDFIVQGDYYAGAGERESAEAPIGKVFGLSAGIADFLSPAPSRIQHLRTCAGAAIELARGDLPSGKWDRISKCVNCGAFVVDDEPTRTREPGLPNWGVSHGKDDVFGSGLPGIWLFVGSIDESDSRRIFQCRVRGPSGHESTYDLADEGMIFKNGNRADRLLALSTVTKEAALFPDERMFSDPPPIPLMDGFYDVTWWAVTEELGEELVKQDFLEWRSGKLVR